MRNLYSYDNVDSSQRYALEKAFSVLEGKVAPILLRLQKGEDISQDEHNAVSEFVGMQYYRTPSKLDVINEVIASGLRYSNEHLRNEAMNMTDENFQKFLERFNKQSNKKPTKITKQQFIDHLTSGAVKVNNDKNFQLSTLVDAGTHLGIKLSARKWIILHANSGHEFITSDVGLHLAPDGKPTQITGYGPGSPGMAVIFPFAKYTALMITSQPKAEVTHADFDGVLVVAVNSGLARVSNQLYSSNNQLLKQLVKNGKLAKTSFEPIFDEEQMQEHIRKHFLKFKP